MSNQILKHEGESVPDRRKATVDRIEALGMVDPDLAERLREAIAFRDVLAHTYGPIVNDELVFDALQHGLQRYVEFVEAVDGYVREHSS